MAAGSIVIDLLMKTGAFETDTKRAEKRLKEFQKQAEKVGAAIGTALAVGALGAVVAFDQLAKAAGDFQDFADTVGDSAENIASLGIAAATAGVPLESVTGAMIKLSRALVGVDDESQEAGAALGALGINVEEFKRLDPVAQYEAVGKALSGFADGASKGTVAAALFGRAGAEQLKVFGALEEQGGRTVILTQKQIELADAYADAQGRSIATLKQYAQAAATEFLPALNDLTEVATLFARELLGINAAGQTVAGDNSIKDFADGVATAIAFAVDQVDLFVRIFQAAGRGIGAILAANVQVMNGNFSQAVSIAKEAISDIDAVFDAATFGERLRAQRAARLAAESNPASYSNEGRAPTKIALSYEGPEKVAAKEKQSDAERYIDALRNTAQSVQELTTFEKLLDDIGRGRLAGATSAQLATAEGLATEIDLRKQLTESRKADADAVSASNQKVQSFAEEASRLAQSVETPFESLNRELTELNRLTAENPFVTAETAARLAESAWKKYGEAVKEAKDETNTFAVQAAANIQDALGESTLSILEGNFSDIEKQWKSTILRMVAQAISAQLGKALLGGDFAKTGQLGGLLGGLFNTSSTPTINPYTAEGYADGGRPPVGFASMVGERGPELFVPNTAGRIVPNEALGGGGRSLQVVTPPGMPLAVQSMEERQSDGRTLEKIILSTVARDARQGGPAIQATAGVLGQRRTLPRRGR